MKVITLRADVAAAQYTVSLMFTSVCLSAFGYFTSMNEQQLYGFRCNLSSGVIFAAEKVSSCWMIPTVITYQSKMFPGVQCLYHHSDAIVIVNKTVTYITYDSLFMLHCTSVDLSHTDNLTKCRINTYKRDLNVDDIVGNGSSYVTHEPPHPLTN